MAGRSEFEKILDDLLGQTSRCQSEVSEPSHAATNSFSEDLLRTIEFSFGPIQKKFFRSVNKIYPHAETKTKDQTLKTEPAPKLELKIKV
jgi:hypothetical protein